MEKSMKVRLVSYSQVAKDFDDFKSIPNLQDLVAYCARVSNPSNQSNTETSDRLLRYLIKNKHWSPFELVSACLEITTSRDIARQILRHRSFSFQEFSQRYADPLKELSFISREARLQDIVNRQNSISIDESIKENKQIIEHWEETQKRIIGQSSVAYNWAIKAGIAKEQARAVLPEGLIESKIYMNGTLRSWMHYCELRSANGTQKEHMDIAKACAKVISKIFPILKDIVNEH
jgi:thymidylate synthase (FAD)